MTLVYERQCKSLFERRGIYDFMKFKYPRQLIRFLKYMGPINIVRIY